MIYAYNNTSTFNISAHQKQQNIISVNTVISNQRGKHSVRSYDASTGACL